MTLEVIDRPPRNRRSIKDDMPWDEHIENALLATQETGKAVKMTLANFHCSPAKGRLWKRGFAVRHRVLPDKEHVAAWIEKVKQPEPDGFITCA